MVRLSDDEEVLTAYLESDMPYVGLTDSLHLSNIYNDAGETHDEVRLNDNIHNSPLEMLHLRCGHVSKSKMLEGYRNMLFTGSGLSRRLFSKKFVK